MPTKAKVITTDVEAVKELRKMEKLQAEAEALMVEHGISDKLAKAAEIKRLVTGFAVQQDLENITMPDGSYYQLRKDTYNKTVIADDADMGTVKNASGITPLKKIIYAKFPTKGKAYDIWKRATRRVVDVKKLDALVAEGVLSVDEIAPAYYFDTKAPYIRKYGG